MKEPFRSVILDLKEQNQNQSTDHHIELPGLGPTQGHTTMGLNEDRDPAHIPLAKPCGLD